MVSSMLELRRTHGELTAAQDAMNLYGAILPLCSSCRKVRDQDGSWLPLEQYVRDHAHDGSHGICPECAKKLYPDYIRG
jgi:two-component system cell cycle response regulator